MSRGLRNYFEGRKKEYVSTVERKREGDVVHGVGQKGDSDRQTTTVGPSRTSVDLVGSMTRDPELTPLTLRKLRPGYRHEGGFLTDPTS